MAKSKSPQKLQHLENQKASVTMNDVSINSTILSSQKTQRKRNLVTELTTILEGEQAAKGCGRKIKLWCPGNNSRPGSEVTAYDVILEDIEILEDNLRSAEENDAGKRLVGRVMRGLKQSMTTMISQVLEVKDLETGLKKQRVRNKRLLTDLTDLEKQKQKLRGEMQAIGKDNHHKNMMLANSWMNDFRQLVMTIGDESGDG
ncbi:unnamed protein product [Lymnaea stagnalis]|uniref:Uncharacterized protein n=1 Tax=Lymnaea stagnalis TaxID=6523 RepID=A0AAV2I6S8_LYMST